VFAICDNPLPTACTPLLQLSALTHLAVDRVDGTAAVAAGVLNVAAQLTGLKKLVLHGLPQLKSLALVQLTALTALQELDLMSDDASSTLPALNAALPAGDTNTTPGRLQLRNKVGRLGAASYDAVSSMHDCCISCERDVLQHEHLFTQVTPVVEAQEQPRTTWALFAR
jgi:hypothetical protein